jgi:chromosome segregation ATPase
MLSCRQDKRELENVIHELQVRAEVAEKQVQELAIKSKTVNSSADYDELKAKYTVIAKERDTLKSRLNNAEEDISILQADLDLLDAGESVSSLKETLENLLDEKSKDSKLIIELSQKIKKLSLEVEYWQENSVSQSNSVVTINNATYTTTQLVEVNNSLSTQITNLTTQITIQSEKLQAELARSQEQLREQLSVNEKLLEAMNFAETLKRQRR